MEEKEFIALITNHQRIIYKVCNLYAQSHTDKEDLFQEITLNAWKGIRNFKGDSLFTTWLYRVALNTALTFKRKENRQRKVDSAVDALAFSHDQQPEADEQLTAMYKAIHGLSDIDKALVTLYLDDYDYKEMGNVLGITANNVAVKMNRLKKKLKEESEKYLYSH
ncbi:RNA polymerase sigma factor [Pinibacter soli]|uniref:RNA polymerase sigma factor n=1 Tax=Pinibacter soli TaxID=3044211 RepID=A0ABT6RCZ5_9BACT|nr:RNA polymerase sigma factor [Pinibacter soli]MDI3320410.1 RNA polymerase sigma factor [Pinibacter soli]